MKKEKIYPFLSGFTHDSAFYINNFLRKHTPEQYRQGKFHAFDFLTGGFDGWGNSALTLQIISYMSRAQDYVDYWPIQPGYIQELQNFAKYMAEQPPLNNPIVVYRGCNSLEVDGVNGIVSTSTDKKIAEQFNRGTLLKINLPKGMKVISLDKVSPDKRSKNIEHEVILPPCDYIIRSDEETSLKGPNNRRGKTRVIELDVKPRDLLREFALVMDNPVKDYINQIGEDEDYREAFMYLLIDLEQRVIENCAGDKKVRGTGLYGGTDVLKREKTACNKVTNMRHAFSLMNSNQAVPNHILNSMKERALNYPGFPKQITTSQFYDYVKGSKARHVFFDYEDREEHQEFYKYQDHGIMHADNVTMFSYYIGSREGYSNDGIRVLMEAARYHDIGRTNSWEEGGHGFAGAKRYANHYRRQIPISEQQIVGFLIQAHDLPNKEDVAIVANKMFGKYCDAEQVRRLCDMANIIRDADALDRTRFPIYSQDYLNSSLLTHDSAKELIEVAQTINYREKIRSRGEKGKNNIKGNVKESHEGK